MRVNMGGQRARLVLRMKFGMRENSGREWIASVTPRGPTKSYSYCQAINVGEREELKIILHFMDSLILSQVESAATKAYKCP